MSKAKNEFKDAEALGSIKTMPETLELMEEPVEESEVINDPNAFQLAIGNAQMDGVDYLEVGEKLFKYLLKNSKSDYLTYGSPGIKVYKEGTRETIERRERMTAEAYHELVSRKV